MSKSVSTADVLSMGALIQSMSMDDLKKHLVTMVSKHPTTALKAVFKREVVNTYKAINKYARDGEPNTIEVSLTPAQLQVLRDAWRDNKILAIKHLRQMTGLGLADSKCVVEWLDEQGYFN